MHYLWFNISSLLAASAFSSSSERAFLIHRSIKLNKITYWLNALNGQPAHSPGQSEAAPWVSCAPWFTCSPCKGKSVTYNDVTWGKQYDKSRGNTLLPLQGVESPVIPSYPGCRFALPWAMRRLPLQGVDQCYPIHNPRVPDFTHQTGHPGTGDSPRLSSLLNFPVPFSL